MASFAATLKPFSKPKHDISPGIVCRYCNVRRYWRQEGQPVNTREHKCYSRPDWYNKSHGKCKLVHVKRRKKNVEWS